MENLEKSWNLSNGYTWKIPGKKYNPRGFGKVMEM